MHKYLKLNFQTTILAAIAITLYWFLPLSDSDYFWHLKTGELIYNSHSILSTDPFSFTMQGEKWVLHEWLFQLLLYITHNILGENGLRGLIVFTIGATLYFSRSATVVREQNRNISLILALWVLLTFFPFMTPRPQIASYLLFSYYLYAINLAITTKQTKYLLPLPFVMVLWVNLHGGYIIGITLLSLFTAISWLNDKQNTSHDKPTNITKHLALITLFTLFASAINPDFIHHWKYPFYVLSMKATSKIGEWHSPNFKQAYAYSFLLLSMLFMFLSAYTKARPSIEKLIIPLFFVMAAFISARNIPFALITIVTFFPKPDEIDTKSFGFIRDIYGAWKRKYTALVSTGSNIGQMEYVTNWIILISLALAIPLANLKINNLQDTYPHQAVDYFIEKELHGNILNEYGDGGYLIYRLHPSSRVFIDGRADMYGDKLFSEYIKLMQGTAEWESIFNNHEIDYIICENDTPIRQLLLQSDNFKTLYADDHYSVIKNLQQNHGRTQEIEKEIVPVSDNK
ncbi:MAG: hypothetical protein ABFS08_02455 [Pseudomonadota bacterium]